MAKKSQFAPEFAGGATAVAEAPVEPQAQVAQVDEQVEPAITVEELFPADKSFSEREAEAWCNIPHGLMGEAIRSRTLSARGDNTVDGPELVRWLRKRSKIEFSAEARDLVRRRRMLYGPRSPAPPKPMSLADQAAKLMTDQASAEASAEADMLARAWADYRAILERFDTPHPGDAEALAALMADLKVTTQQISEDREILARAKMLTDRHARRAALNDAVVEARRVRDETIRRHALELRTAVQDFRAADRHASEARGASFDLLRLSRRRPQFFDTTVDPPQLREESA